MGILIPSLILILFLIFLVLRSSRLTKTEKLSIIIFIILFFLIGITYIFITGWERGRDPQIPEYEKIEQDE
ncbi:hypothetical protein [Riemerella anatipestifer]|uniref:hypothetical protein n=1 Tax=Riemerella anatipestifer TaxID=34085 RepID=UPI00129D8D45|nr:hypothetical protein [Riemerella anatipestifer]MRM83993.1 hypothetical protein [Riemerella anatipestifer]